MDTAVETWGLTKKGRSGTAVLDNVYLRVPAGKALGLLGPEGAGKTTLFKILLGLQKPTTGGGFCLGLDLVTESIFIRDRVTYAENKPHLYEYLSVQEMIDLTRKFYSHWNSAVADKYLDVFELPLRQKIKKLSLRRKQMLALILALAPEPDLLLLDEPAPSPAKESPGQEFFDAVTTEIVNKGRTAVVAARRLDEIKMMASEVTLIYRGRTRGIFPLAEIEEKVKEEEIPSDAGQICPLYFPEPFEDPRKPDAQEPKNEEKPENLTILKEEKEEAETEPDPEEENT